MAEVVDARTFSLPDRPNCRLPGKPRLEATITDHRGTVTCTSSGSGEIGYCRSQLRRGRRLHGQGDTVQRRAGWTSRLVILDEHGAVIGGAAHNASLASASVTLRCTSTRWLESCVPGRSPTVRRWP